MYEKFQSSGSGNQILRAVSWSIISTVAKADTLAINLVRSVILDRDNYSQLLPRRRGAESLGAAFSWYICPQKVLISLLPMGSLARVNSL